MVAVKNYTELQNVYIDKNISHNFKLATLILTNRCTNKSKYIEVFEVVEYNDYYDVLVLINDLEPGEYEYRLSDLGETIASGMMVVLTEKRKYPTYNDAIEYKSYDPTKKSNMNNE